MVKFISTLALVVVFFSHGYSQTDVIKKHYMYALKKRTECSMCIIRVERTEKIDLFKKEELMSTVKRLTGGTEKDITSDSTSTSDIVRGKVAWAEIFIKKLKTEDSIKIVIYIL